MVKKALAGFLAILFLTACPAAATAKVSPMDFNDIQGHWAITAISQMVTTGYMDGVGTSEAGSRVFAPDAPATRAQAAAVLTRMFRLDYGAKRFIKQPLAADYYADVPNDTWYSDDVVMCAINDIFPTGGSFHPEQSISRLEMAQAIMNCFTAKGIQVVMIMMMPVYDDTQQLSPEELNAVAFVTNTGIMKGDNNCFRPNDPLTRAEMAQVLSNSLAVVKRHVDLDENNNGQQYEITEGQYFNLTLPENPSTGYQWAFTETYDPNILTQIDHAFQAPKSQPPLAGQGGWIFWRFQALHAGTTTLNLGYARSWESTPPVQTYTVKIIVVPSSSKTDTLDVTVTRQEIKESSDTMKTDLSIPIINGLSNLDIQNTLNTRWEQDALAFKDQVSAGVQDYVRSRQNASAPIFPYEAVTSYEYRGITNNILSLTIDYYQYTGGAHGGTDRRAYNIDI